MPGEHADVIAEVHATIAVVDGEWEAACKRDDSPLHPLGQRALDDA